MSFFILYNACSTTINLLLWVLNTAQSSGCFQNDYTFQSRVALRCFRWIAVFVLLITTVNKMCHLFNGQDGSHFFVVDKESYCLVLPSA